MLLGFSTDGKSYTTSFGLKMHRDKTILAIIPARSGSKRIPGKNMQEINGVSLIGWAGKCLGELDWVDAKFLSSEMKSYVEEGYKYNLKSALRPSELATDTSPIEDTLFLTLTGTETYYLKEFDIILLIEPTSPMRKPSDIKNAVDLLIDTGADSVVTVSKVDERYYPPRIFEIDKWGGVIFQHSYVSSGWYYRNGICYALTRQCVQGKQIMEGALPLIIDRPVVNIDTPLDLEIARMLMQ